MPKRDPSIPKVRMTLWLPLDLRARLDLDLASKLEGRVPYGTYGEFFENLLREHFKTQDAALNEPGT